MNIEKVKLQIIVDEGRSLTVYADQYGNLTVGIGHKVLPGDNLKQGDTITDRQCAAFFALDFETARDGCERTTEYFDSMPEEIQEVLVNMAFNLGISGLGKFCNMLAAASARNWPRMAAEMKCSLWHRQLPERSDRLIKIVENQFNKGAMV